MGRGRIKDLVARGDFSEHLELGSPVVSTVCRGGSLGDRSDCLLLSLPVSPVLVRFWYKKSWGSLVVPG